MTKTIHMLASFLAAFLAAGTVQAAPTIQKDTLQAKLSQPRFRPDQAVDTLETSDPELKMVLYSDNTWEFISNEEIAKNSSLYGHAWHETLSNPYRESFESLPDSLVLVLADSTSKFVCPYITRVYSAYGYRWGRIHAGVDLPYPTGTPVKAAFDGRCRVSDWVGGYGNLIVIRHTNGLETFYGHLSRRDLKPGDWVNAGDIIGLGGSTGHSTGPHLHFETRYHGHHFSPQWIIDFEKGVLKSDTAVLYKRYMNGSCVYGTPGKGSASESASASSSRSSSGSSAVYHTVKSGDTLSSIAAKYHTTVQKICSLNGIKANKVLSIGKRLRVK